MNATAKSAVGAVLFSVVPLFVTLDVSAAPIFFDDRQAFLEAAGALAGFEDFEAANTNPATSMPEPESWDIDSDDSVFSPGDIAEGIRFSGGTGDLVAVAGGFSPASTGAAIGPASLENDLLVSFQTDVNAFGFDLFNLGEGEEMFRISMRDVFDEFVAEAFVSAGPLGSFFGVIDDGVLFSEFGINQNLANDVIDNVVFGIASPTAVSEPGTLALFCAGLLGFAAARRKRPGVSGQGTA